MQKLLILALVASFSASYAQKVDLDKFHFNVSYQRLPKEFVPLENRTYGARVVIGGALRSYTDENIVYDKIKIHGWKKIEATPTVGIEMNLDDFAYRGSNVKSKTNEQKDKDGKVTSRTTIYWVEAGYEARGICRVKGPVTPKPLTEKEQEELKKKEEAKTNNRFLANVSVNKEPEVTGGFNIGLGISETYSTSENASSSLVSQEFQNKKDAIYSEKLRGFVDGSINRVNYSLNSTYGFTPIQEEDYLWILNSKDHPEYQTQQDAIQAVKELFKTMKANESITALESNLAPLIDYLQSLKTKYKGDDKRNRKLRYSAYYNLSKIYYYLDKPEKAREEAEGLIKNEFDEKDGEKLAEYANIMADAMKLAKTNTRHNPGLQ